MSETRPDISGHSIHRDAHGRVWVGFQGPWRERANGWRETETVTAVPMTEDQARDLAASLADFLAVSQ